MVNDIAATATDGTPDNRNKDNAAKELSPNAMANAVLKEAMQQQETSAVAKATASSAEEATPAAKRSKHDHVEEEEISEDFKALLENTWNDATDEKEIENAYGKTMSLISTQVEGLIRAGLDAFHRWEKSTSDLNLLKEDLENKDLEIERLRAAEEKSRATISNLLRAVETSKAEARDNSRAALTEAGLRAELSVMVSKKDEAVSSAEEHKRKSTLLEEELRQVKVKLSRVTQEKIKMERDQRATMSLAKSLDSHVSSDVDYYKRKVTELNGHLQGMNAVLSEKNRQIEDMRHQIERSMSQNRLANLRGENGKGRKRSI